MCRWHYAPIRSRAVGRALNGVTERLNADSIPSASGQPDWREAKVQSALKGLTAKGEHIGRAATLPIETMLYIHQLQGEGLAMQKIADRVTAEEIKTATGGKWYPSTIKRVLDSVTLANALKP